MITYEHIGYLKNEEERIQFLELLKQCDNDFVPPLSTRSFEESELAPITEKEKQLDGPIGYFQMILRHYMIVAREDGKVVGCLSYTPHHSCEQFPLCNDSNYITNICVSPNNRGQHIAENLYRFLEMQLPEQYEKTVITVRTWSTNQAQVHMLQKLGYVCGAVLKNDRGPGVDTVYYYRQKSA